MKLPLNEGLVIAAIADGNKTQASIRRATGLSRSAIVSALAELEGEGAVVQSPIEHKQVNGLDDSRRAYTSYGIASVLRAKYEYVMGPEPTDPYRPRFDPSLPAFSSDGVLSPSAHPYLDVLADAPEPLAASQIANALDSTPQATRRYLKKLVDTGVVLVEGSPKRYRLIGDHLATARHLETLSTRTPEQIERSETIQRILYSSTIWALRANLEGWRDLVEQARTDREKCKTCLAKGGAGSWALSWADEPLCHWHHSFILSRAEWQRRAAHDAIRLKIAHHHIEALQRELQDTRAVLRAPSSTGAQLERAKRTQEGVLRLLGSCLNRIPAAHEVSTVYSREDTRYWDNEPVSEKQVWASFEAALDELVVRSDDRCTSSVEHRSYAGADEY